MPSPFPGMNPYLEQSQISLDFHNTFLITLREVLVPQLRPRYVVRADEHVYIRDTDPTQVPAVIDKIRSVYLEVLAREGGEVVTTIELLSPWNKETGPDRDAYRAKVRRILASPANLVEIDLLRGGPRMPWVNLPACDYYAVVSRAETRPKVDIWPVRLRDPLPRIPIPVRPGEAGATIDLQALLNRAYDSAGYGYFIYRGVPEPRLAPADAAWAAQFLPPGG